MHQTLPNSPESSVKAEAQWRHTFDSLKDRNFRIFFASTFGQQACMNMQMLVNGWFVYQLTGSTSLLGLTMLANATSSLSLSFIGGFVADRVPRKSVMAYGLGVNAITACFIALVTSLHIITWHFLVVSSLIQGGVMALTMPSRQSMVKGLVGEDRVTNAVAFNTAGMNVNQIGAPALAGFLVGFTGLEGVYYLIAIIFVISSFLAFKLPKQTLEWSVASRVNLMRSFKDGLQYVRGNTALYTILVLSLLTVLLSMPFRALLPVFAEDVLNIGPERLGVLMALSGIGALVGSLLIAAVGVRRRGMLFLHTGLITGLSVLAFTLTTSYHWALMIMVVTGLGQAGRMAISNSLIQSYTDDEHLGRVMSLYMMQFGLTSLGSFGVSVVAEVVGVRWAVGATAAVLVLVTVWYYAFSAKIRKLD